MRTRFRTAVALGVGTLGLLALGAPAAVAQTTGRIYLTSEKVPEDAKGAALRKVLRKSLKVLKKGDGAESWSAYGFAKLRTRPSNKLMKLEVNGGKIQIIVRKRIKRRWVRQKIGEFEYSDRARLVRFELSITDGNQIPTRKLHKLELVVQNKRKKDIVLARTTFKIQ